MSAPTLVSSTIKEQGHNHSAFEIVSSSLGGTVSFGLLMFAVKSKSKTYPLPFVF